MMDETALEQFVDDRIRSILPKTLLYRLKREKRDNELIDERLNEIVSNRLRQAREFAGFKQLKAAQQLGYQDPGALSKIERWTEHKDRSIPIALIVRAAALYGVTTDYLLGLSDYYENDVEALTRRFVAQSVLESWERAREEDMALILGIVNEVGVVSESMTDICKAIGPAEQALEWFRTKNRKIEPDEDGNYPVGFDELHGGNKLLTEMGRLSVAVRRCSARLRELRERSAKGHSKIGRNRRLSSVLQMALGFEMVKSEG
jgi:transcriptional regulator with XRE-family HTH domain